MTSTPVPNVRLTISVSPEVHSAFHRLAKARSMSISKAMGEWLGDTLDAAEYMAQTLEKARAAPKLVAQELHAYALGLGDETGELLKRLRSEGRLPAVAAQRPRTEVPPSGNTGGKGTRSTTKVRRGPM
jgi:hypothetical protein